MPTRRFFVYGTFLRGECRHAVVQGCRFLGERDLQGILYDTGYGYPAALFDPQFTSKVSGELYEISAGAEREFLERMDKIEGVDFGLFERREVHQNGDSFYVYEAGTELRRQLKEHQKIGAGYWKKR